VNDNRILKRNISIAGRKGGSAFIPIVNGGDFPLRPLHPRKLKEAYDLLTDYCMNRPVSFRLEDLEKDLEQSPADYWMERFGDDPIWG
jgi:hypothetical protein